jgi:tRNA(Phe) wybutosine-synthesizing methylase Tyw3
MPDKNIQYDAPCWMRKKDYGNNFNIEKTTNHKQVEIWGIPIDENIVELFKAINFNDDSHIYTHMSCQYDKNGFSSFSFNAKNYSLWVNKVYDLTLKKFNLEKEKNEDDLFLEENENFVVEFFNKLKIYMKCHIEKFETIITLTIDPEDIEYAIRLLNELII